MLRPYVGVSFHTVAVDSLDFALVRESIHK